MIRKLTALGLVLLLLFAVTACGSTESSQAEGSGEDESVAGQEGSTQEGPVADTEGETKGLGTLGIPGLFGEIKEVIGNEVTLLLIENAEGEEAAVPGSGMKRGSSGTEVVREYTGEEVTILIPVGTNMVKRVPQSGTGETGASTGTGTGPVEEAVGLTELVKGATLKIYYQEESASIIEKILVQSPRS